MERCRNNATPKFNGGSVFCAAKFGSPDSSCRGDSGGPALWFDGIKNYQVGTIHGSIANCDGSRFPTIFVRMDNPDVLEWITDKTAGKFFLCIQQFFDLRKSFGTTKTFLKSKIFLTHHAEARCYPPKKVPKKTLQIQKI